MKNIVRLILCLFILGGGAGLTYRMITSKKAPERQPRPRSQTHVDAMLVTPVDYPVNIRTQGLVQPRTETTLIPQVAGAIVQVAPGFRDGGYFEEGDVLFQIERIDYETAVTVADATVARASLQVDQERARAAQAKREWERLGKEGEPSALVLREPQVKEALAALSAASAQREKTRRDLKRTTIKAPYAGRVFERSVDVGQYVSPGTRLGRIYAIDYVEIPLPLSDRQLEFVDLPHVYRGEQAKLGGTKVTILVEQGSRAWTYPGRLVRTRGAVDARSRQTSVVAQVDDPYGRHGDRPPLKVGMFVKAEIEGRILPGSIVLPQAALREGRYVLLIDDQNQLQRMPVTIRWSEKDVVVIASGVKPGDLVCLTPVAYDVTGAKVIPSINGKVRRIESREAPQAGLSGDVPGKGGGKTGRGPAKQP